MKEQIYVSLATILFKLTAMLIFFLMENERPDKSLSSVLFNLTTILQIGLLLFHSIEKLKGQTTKVDLASNVFSIFSHEKS